MTVALSDTYNVSQALKDLPDLGDNEAVCDALLEFYEKRKPLASTINILAFALYDVFCGGSDGMCILIVKGKRRLRFLIFFSCC